VTEENLYEAMPELKKRGSVLLVHAELPEPIEKAAEELKDGNPRDYKTFLESRPRESENKAVELMIRLCRSTGARSHRPSFFFGRFTSIKSRTRRRLAGDGRNLSSLSDFHGRRNSRRRDAL
jgi:hypothetical protein